MTAYLNPETLDNPFQADAVIEFGDATELHPFEDIVATYLRPSMNGNGDLDWRGRLKLKDLLRPHRFNGPFADISLQVMDNPVVQLESARSRGYSFNSGRVNTQLKQRFAESYEQNQALGFSFQANATSAGRGVIGLIQAELWYLPSNGTMTHGGTTGVHRVVTKPLTDHEKFVDLEAESTRIAYKLLSVAVRHARPNGFHN